MRGFAVLLQVPLRVRVRTDACGCACAHPCVCACMCAYMHVCIHACVHTCMRACRCACMQVCMHARTPLCRRVCPCTSRCRLRVYSRGCAERVARCACASGRECMRRAVVRCAGRRVFLHVMRFYKAKCRKNRKIVGARGAGGRPGLARARPGGPGAGRRRSRSPRSAATAVK